MMGLYCVFTTHKKNRHFLNIPRSYAYHRENCQSSTDTATVSLLPTQIRSPRSTARGSKRTPAISNRIVLLQRW